MLWRGDAGRYRGHGEERGGVLDGGSDKIRIPSGTRLDKKRLTKPFLSEAAKALWVRTKWRRNRLKAGAPHALLPTNYHHSLPFRRPQLIFITRAFSPLNICSAHVYITTMPTSLRRSSMSVVRRYTSASDVCFLELFAASIPAIHTNLFRVSFPHPCTREQEATVLAILMTKDARIQMDHC